MPGVRISGIGRAAPEQVITNEDITKRLSALKMDFLEHGVVNQDDDRLEQFDSDPQWIEERTGIRKRHIVTTETTSDLAASAAREAILHAGILLEEIDFILLATVTPDFHASPPTVSLVQEKLGISCRTKDGVLRHITVADVSLACCSFMTALEMGDSLIRSGKAKTGLVIGADVMSSITNPYNRGILPLFGDAAGCFVLEAASDRHDTQFYPQSFLSGTDGSLADLIKTPIGGSKCPLDFETMHTISDPFGQEHCLVMDGREMYKRVVPFVAEVLVPELLRRNEHRIEHVGAILFHQANGRMISAIEEKIRRRYGCEGIMPQNISHYANTTSATIPVLFYEAVQGGLLRPDMWVALVSFGGGMSWSAALMNMRDFPPESS